MSDSGGSTPGRTQRLCAFLADTTYEDVPGDVLDHATEMLLDGVGVTLAATESDPANAIRTAYAGAYATGGDRRANDARPARVPGTGERGRARDVALLTGVMAHALDFDDVHQGMGGHPSTPVLSALLPIAEREHAAGRDLLRSFVLGTEVEITLARVLNPGHYERGWHPTAVLGTMGAAAAVGDLLGLEPAARRTALGIAASKAAGVKGNFGTMTKPLHVGQAARNGVEAAQLAANGFTANREILELEFGGFCELFQGDPGYDFDDHLDRLGAPWGLLDPPVGFKPYLCCGSVHATIDAALALREAHAFDPPAVDAVRVRAHPRRLGHTDRPDPATALDGKFSVQYCVAVALTDGAVRLDHFADDVVAGDRYRRLLDRVEVVRDRGSFEARTWGGGVTVVAAGTEHTETVDAPRGSAQRPMSTDELEEKYRRCAGRALDDVDESLASLRNLDGVDDVAELLDDLV